MTAPTPFEIVPAADGSRVATNGESALVLQIPSAELFRRRAVKNAGTENAQRLEWIVARVNGVSVYFDGTTVVVSDKDLTP